MRMAGHPPGLIRWVQFYLWTALLGLTAAGCSTFDRDWNTLEEPASGLQGAEGRWSGEWRSVVTGHSGGLRCIVSRGEDGYRARYRATYAALLSFEYTVTMDLQEGETVRLRGAEDLGWFAGGVYRYDGEVRGDAFTSTYESAGDLGVFEMTRFVEAAGTAPDG